jgi:DNA-binding CsgD family transcriptional regulator
MDSRSKQADDGPMSTDIIGRERELAAIREFLDRPAEGPQAFVLEGDAGIGKSTLWLAAIATAREGGSRVLVSRPAETEHTFPNVVLGDLFADVDVDVLESLPTPRRRAFEAALLREEPDTSVDPRTLGVAVVTVLTELAQRPLLLAIDDDQWMDATSAATLRFALRRLNEVPVHVLLARRTDTDLPVALEELIDPGKVERLRLGPLSLGALQQLLRQRLDVTLPRPVLLRIHEVSGGNPFHALELARARSMDPSLDVALPLAVPASLERLVDARIKELDAPSRSALLLVAAHGRLPVRLLRVLKIDADALDPALAGRVVEVSSDVVSFSHPLLASTVYHGATAQQRRVAHRLLAAALDDPVDRGRHLALAAEAPDDELATVLDVAADVARDRGMAIAAAQLRGEAFRLTQAASTNERHRRSIATARAINESGEGARARLIVDGLLATASPGSTRAETLMVAAELGHGGDQMALLTEALAEAAGSPRLEAMVHAKLADWGRGTMKREWAERHARASLRLAEELDADELLADALLALAPLLFDRGDPDGLRLAERAHRLAVDLDDPRLQKVSGEVVAHILAWSGLADRARDWLEDQLRRWGDRDEVARWSILAYLGLVEFWSGRWIVASAYAEEVAEIAAQYDSDTPGYFVRALIAVHRGQFEDATAYATGAMATARLRLVPLFPAVLGICEMWRGRPAAALPFFAKAKSISDRRGLNEPNMRWWRAEHIEALLQAGRIDDAERLLADWEGRAVSVSRERVTAQQMRCHGLIAAARGDLPAAIDLLQDAVERHETVGDPFGRGRALLALGVVRLRARQKRTARSAFESSLVVFEDLGAASWAAAVRSQLARISGRARIEGLSPSERRVAELVAEGRTNREVAAALFLGERTVASHLTHVYSKLGIRSRTELANQFRPADPVPAGAVKASTS